jgi:hypothetical protein
MCAAQCSAAALVVLPMSLVLLAPSPRARGSTPPISTASRSTLSAPQKALGGYCDVVPALTNAQPVAGRRRHSLIWIGLLCSASSSSSPWCLGRRWVARVLFARRSRSRGCPRLSLSLAGNFRHHRRRRLRLRRRQNGRTADKRNDLRRFVGRRLDLVGKFLHVALSHDLVQEVGEASAFFQDRTRGHRDRHLTSFDRRFGHTDQSDCKCRSRVA